MRPHHLTILLALAGLLLVLGGASCSGVDPELGDAFRAHLGSTSISVYPAAVRRTGGHSYHAASAETIAAFLREHELAEVHLASAEVPLPGDGGRNQSRQWKTSARAFAAWLAEHPFEGEFALLPEYLMGRERAGGIHAYVIDREGRVVDGVGLNSHHEPFREAEPATAEQCAAVLVTVLAQRWLDEQAG